MKTQLGLCALLILSAVYFLSCNNKPYSQDISILADQTEEYFKHFTVDEIRKVSMLKVSENNSEYFRIQPLTESGFNEVKSFKLDPVISLLMGNDYERENEIRNYFSSIDSAFTELRAGRQERLGSVIYKIMSEELNRLSESKADKRILIINSDLMEKSFINFYDSTIFYRIKNTPDQLQKTLLKKYPLNDLSGIEVWIIYKPINKTDSEKFEIISDFYKLLLKSCGANVNVRGNL